MAKKISQEIKDKIVDKIKSEGLSVAQAAREFGVNGNTVYGWLGKGKIGSDTLELGKLRRENQQLKMIIAEVMLDSGKGKKNR
ncbi:MAG: transposase [bacterium]